MNKLLMFCSVEYLRWPTCSVPTFVLPNPDCCRLQRSHELSYLLLLQKQQTWTEDTRLNVEDSRVERLQRLTSLTLNGAPLSFTVKAVVGSICRKKKGKEKKCANSPVWKGSHEQLFLTVTSCWALFLSLFCVLFFEDFAFELFSPLSYALSGCCVPPMSSSASSSPSSFSFLPCTLSSALATLERR